MFVCKEPIGCASKRRIWGAAPEQIAGFSRLQNAWKSATFELDPHVVRRQRERGISRADIRYVLLHGRLLEFQQNARYRRARMMSRLPAGRILHVIVEWGHDTHRVITAMDPASRPWQWNEDYTQRLHWCVKNHLDDD